jgi:hypothetical protein
MKAKCEEIAAAEGIINNYNTDTIYDTLFITQIYDTNEYEGDVTVIGDDEWDKEEELINDCSETDTSDVVDIELVESACWYSLPENPEEVMNCSTTLTCGDSFSFSDYDHAFSINEITINGDTLQLPNTYTEQMYVDGSSNNINWVSANNDVVSGATTGLTYTNFVDFLNNVFVEFGIDDKYKAQISTEKTVNGFSGFYIIKPETDSFSFLMVQTGYGSYDKVFSDQGLTEVTNGITLVDGEIDIEAVYGLGTLTDVSGGSPYEQSSCEGNNVVDGVVIE